MKASTTIRALIAATTALMLAGTAQAHDLPGNGCSPLRTAVCKGTGCARLARSVCRTLRGSDVAASRTLAVSDDAQGVEELGRRQLDALIASLR